MEVTVVKQSPRSYDLVNQSNVNWICWNCGLPNFDSSLFQNTSDFSNIETSNYYSSLLNESILNSEPLLSSTPARGHNKPTNKTRVATNKPKQKPLQNLKILNVNCRSICNKAVELENLIQSVDVDIIIGTESWLNSSIKSSEIFPSNMNIFRKDREGSKGGGVFIAVSDKYIVSHQPQLETECELLWIKLETTGNKSTYIGAFYRPHENDVNSLENLNSSLNRLKNTNSNIYIAGDFNLPGIDWDLG